MNREFGIHFGALADPISTQIEKQGFKFSKEKVAQFEAYIDAIHTLRFASLLNDSDSDKVIKKLYKQIVTHVTKVNKLKSNP